MHWFSSRPGQMQGQRGCTKSLKPPLGLVWSTKLGSGHTDGWCVGGLGIVAFINNSKDIEVRDIATGTLKWALKKFTLEGNIWFSAPWLFSMTKDRKKLRAWDVSKVIDGIPFFDIDEHWPVGAFGKHLVFGKGTTKFRSLTTLEVEKEFQHTGLYGIIDGSFLYDSTDSSYTDLGAFSLASGQDLWRIKFSPTQTEVALLVHKDILVTRNFHSATNSLWIGRSTNTGDERWRHTFSVNDTSRAGISTSGGGLIFFWGYAPSDEQKRGIWAVDICSGKDTWFAPFNYYDGTRPIATGDVVWFIDFDFGEAIHVLVALDAKSGKRIWNYKLDANKPDLSAVVDGHLLVRNGNKLLCFASA